MITQRLAQFAATLTFEDLPADVVLKVKQLTLDTLGTALAATTLGAGCREVVDVMCALGGKPESRIIGHAAKVSAPHAAFANGALAHALNYDAVGTETGHTGVVCLTAPLAIADAAGTTTGRQFITAAAVAAEVTARVTAAGMHGRHALEQILAGQYFGYFGAAAGAGRLLELSPAAMHSAFGLALMQVSGTRQVVIGGDPPAKAIYGAFPNLGGVLAAILAKAGLGADIDALEGSAGFYALATDGRYDRDLLLEGLGTRFQFMHTQFKPWPTSAVVAPFIEAAIDLATRYDLKVADIEAVEIAGSPQIRAWCEPLDERRRPPNAAAAANSTLFATAKALAHREVVLADFTPEGLHDEPALRLTARMTYRLDDRVPGGIVTIRATDGRRLEAEVEQPLGHPSRPMSAEHLAAKFRDCCSYSTAVGPADVRDLTEFINTLEDAADVSRLAAPHLVMQGDT